MKTVTLKVTKHEREDILFALRMWLKNNSESMDGQSKRDIESLIEKVDCKGFDI